MLSPDEIEVKEFLVALRGYRTDEVRDFLTAIADELRAVHAELFELRDLAARTANVVRLPRPDDAGDHLAVVADSDAHVEPEVVVQPDLPTGRPHHAAVGAVVFDPDAELARIEAVGRELARVAHPASEVRTSAAGVPSVKTLWERLDDVINAVAELQSSAVDVIAHANERRAAASTASTSANPSGGELNR
jgi:DivIVA domain-containing protein